MNKEIRTSDINPVDDDTMKIQGFALRFNEESNNLGGFTEVISPEALAEADMSDVRMLINHDPNFVIGRNTSGTLNLEIREEGLWFECTLPNTTYGKDIYESIRRGDISQCSFGMVVSENGDDFEKRSSGIFKRTINKISTIFDCSVVSFPAYNSSSVEPALRSIENIKQAEIDEVNKQNELETMRLKLELLRLKK